MSPSLNVTDLKMQNQCNVFENNDNGPSTPKGSLLSDVIDNNSSSPLIRISPDPESGLKNTTSTPYFGGYTLFEVFCIILIALSGLSILILLLAWGPITTLQLKYWKESTARDIMNNDNGQVESKVFDIMPNSITTTPKNAFFSGPFQVQVNSYADLNKINLYTTELKIVSLMDYPEIISARTSDEISYNDKIKRLELFGPVSRQGLEMLFTKFRSIQYLYVDVDKVRYWSDNSKKNPAEVMKMQELTSIFLQNSEKTKLLDWPIDLVTPKLKKLKVVDAILNLKNFNQLQKFVAAAQETLEEIEITQCFICDECDLADVQYDNLVKITANKRRTKETLKDVEP